jgi:glycine/D-amino acid oxidase-like deaminating enzyme
MARVSVVGAGGVGTAVALELLKQGHDVTMVSREFAGGLNERCGITTYWAAGIGCIFKPSSPYVGQLVLESYEQWMSLARNQSNRFVMETELKIVTKPNEHISYESQVEGFTRLDETTAKYNTYSFNPKMLLEARIAEMRKLGASFEIRNISADEVKQLREGIPLQGSDYTVEAIGLGARDIHPELDLYPVAGVLVHYIDRATGELRDSYMHEDKALYVVTRPSPQGREIVLGGTFLEHIGDVSPEERNRLAHGIIQNVPGEFGPRGFDISRLSATPREITVGFRPAIKGDPAIQKRGKVSVVTGFSGQGLVTNPAVARLVAEQVGQAASYFSGVSLPPVDEN